MASKWWTIAATRDQTLDVENGQLQNKTNVHILLGALKTCSKTRDLERGKQIHAKAVECGHDCNTYIANALINMYGKCGSMVDAQDVFNSTKHRTVVSWNSLILGYAEMGQGVNALDLFCRMNTEGPTPSSVTLLAALKACTSLALKQGPSRWTEWKKRAEAIGNMAVDIGCNADVHVHSTLVNMYSKCGNMIDTFEVFESMTNPPSASWNVIILGYAENGEGHIALDMFTRMRIQGCEIDSVTLVAALKACTSLAVTTSQCRNRVQQIHNISMENDSDVYVQSTLMDMYSKSGSMRDAHELFDSMKSPTVVSWNVLILGYTENGQSDTTLDMFIRMRTEGIEPDPVTLVAALKACASVSVTGARRSPECLDSCEAIYSVAGENGCSKDSYVQSTLLDIYAKCGNMVNAHEIFKDMKHADTVSWNVLILGYAENGQSGIALDMFSRMEAEGAAPNSVTFLAVLKACTSLAVEEGVTRWADCRYKGKQIHNIAVEKGYNLDVHTQNSLIDMYSKCGSMVYAREIFDSIRQPTVVSWTVLMLGYADNCQGSTALNVFTKMRNEGPAPDSITLVAALKVCTFVAVKEASQWAQCRDMGKEIHSIAVKNGCISDFHIQNLLVDMYAKCGSMADAHEVFDGIKHPTVVLWTVLILGYADNEQGHIALLLFARMRSEGHAPDSVTLVAALKACTAFAVKEECAKCTSIGKEIQNIIVEDGCISDVYVESTLVDMYAKCGSMTDAREVFDIMKRPNVVSWTALILGYVDNGQAQTALGLFIRMRDEGPPPDSVTFGAALKACGLVGALEFGRTIHSELDSKNNLDVVLVTCLVDFYAKCGSLSEAQSIFDSHPKTRDMITWNALLAGFISYGDDEIVFRLFKGMQHAGFRPDAVTFLCLLMCCSHRGLVAKGKECFDSMSTKYGIFPTIKHYTCMVDLLGRANKLGDAVVLLKHMPCSPDDVTWRTILSACRKWKNVEIGRLSFRCLLDLNSKDVTAFVLMGQIYGSQGMVQEQEMVMDLRKELKAQGRLGEAYWTDEVGGIHTFSVEDNRHPQIHKIHEKWESLVVVMRHLGSYNPSEDVETECGHSERMAIVCALINSKPGKTIRVVKNLGICDDCHSASALISKLECRTIICRNANGIHVFRDGNCSCGNFW